MEKTNRKCIDSHDDSGTLVCFGVENLMCVY